MYWNEDYEDYIEEENESYNMMDSIFNDIKEKFYERLKLDVKQKIKDLEEENELLNAEVNHLHQALNAYKSRENNIKLEVSRARLSNLFKEVGMVYVLYTPTWKGAYKKKCDKCDDNRRIYYKTPMGRDANEMCECSEYKKMFYPMEYELVRFCINTWGSDKDKRPMFLWFEECDYEKEEFRNERRVTHIYNDEPYEELWKKFGEYSNGLFFKSKEECQKYCDWLSELYGWTSDMVYDSKCNEIKSK